MRNRYPTRLEQPAGEPAQWDFPPSLPALLKYLPRPALLYDMAAFRQRVQGMVRLFPLYRYPLKSNPHPELVAEALALGAGVDVCSEGELEVALSCGARGALLGYCSVALWPDLVDTLAQLEARVTLNAPPDLDMWESRTTAPFGLRIGEGGEGAPYRAKFGFRQAELEAMFRREHSQRLPLRSLHLHTAHSANAADFLARYEPLLMALRRLGAVASADLEEINLGGGWPVAYDAMQQPLQPVDLADNLRREMIPALASLGFGGTVAVEPGEHVVSDCGYWIADVCSVRQMEDGGVLAVLRTPGVVPSAELDYPVAIYRESGGWQRVHGRHGPPCTFVAATNSPFDTIRRGKNLPEVRSGDVVVFAQSGAYLPTLLNGFNSIPRPPEYVI